MIVTPICANNEVSPCSILIKTIDGFVGTGSCSWNHATWLTWNRLWCLWCVLLLHVAHTLGREVCARSPMYSFRMLKKHSWWNSESHGEFNDHGPPKDFGLDTQVPYIGGCRLMRRGYWNRIFRSIPRIHWNYSHLAPRQQDAHGVREKCNSFDK